MTPFIQSASKIYGILLRLFPREFQNEFKEEMEDVFTANLEETAKAGTTLVIRACFFELFDLPVNLVVEHLSDLRKRNSMKTFSYEVGRSRAVLMAALGMMVGWVLINLGGQYIQIIFRLLQPWMAIPLGMIEFSLPIVLCGVMLGIAASSGRRCFLRIGLWTMAGGMLGHLVTLPVRMVNSRILSGITAYPRSWNYDSTFMLCLVAVMCVYGLFYGAGLGFALGGWKASKKFALIGLVANAIGTLVGYFISTGVSSRVQLSNDISSTITWSIMGALAGGIFGWFFGKGRQPEADPVVRPGNA